MLRFLTNSEMGHIATDFEPQLTYRISKNCYKNMVDQSFWTDFDATMRAKQFLDTFESYNSRKIAQKLRFSEADFGTYW